ncbi:MAG: YcxB family protein [Eubacteriales bacterium]|nr:YcxB family protein [Eubacteriales bacterium]
MLKASIHHTESTLKALLKYQDRVCHPIINYIGGAGCIILVILAIMLQPYIGKITTAVFSFLGCWLFVTNRYRPKQLYENMMRNFGNIFPTINYTFTENNIEIERAGKKQSISYNQITDISESTKYCFFIYQKKVAFMFAKDSSSNIDLLMNMISENTSLKWNPASKRSKLRYKKHGGQ